MKDKTTLTKLLDFWLVPEKMSYYLFVHLIAMKVYSDSAQIFRLSRPLERTTLAHKSSWSNSWLRPGKLSRLFALSLFILTLSSSEKKNNRERLPPSCPNTQKSFSRNLPMDSAPAVVYRNPSRHGRTIRRDESDPGKLPVDRGDLCLSQTATEGQLQGNNRVLSSLSPLIPGV